MHQRLQKQPHTVHISHQQQLEQQMQSFSKHIFYGNLV
jgi:hypothetical protein